MDEMNDVINDAEILVDDGDAVPAVENAGMTARSTATISDEAERDIGLLGDVEVTATVELGRTQMPVRDVLKLHQGSVVELDKLVGQPADLLINNTLMARGEVIVINERFGFRITKFYASPGK